MPELTNENNKPKKAESTENASNDIVSNKEEKISNKSLEESIVSKAIKEAKEKVANEVRESLKQDISKDRKEAKKELEENQGLKEILEDNKEKEDKKIEVKKEEQKKEETVIQKIKNFIAKIVAMQEEAKKESEEKKALKESEKEKKKAEEKNAKIDLEKNPKYMLEYYDLPYRYNETVVKILAQTPKRLFVYWDISDSDRNKYKTAFGERFFEDTYPVLLVHNEEKNYTFEVPINDFANSWYLDINDPKSKYVIQLGRKFKTKPEFVNIASSDNTVVLQNDYVPITTSNVLEVPNDHILFENIGTKALYKNVKTNEESYVDVANSEFMNKVGKIYSIYDLYKEIYKNELGDGTLTDLLNPSSMSSSGTNSSMFR